MNTLKKVFGTMAVLGLVSGLASSAVAASFTAASVEPVVWLDAGVGVTTGGTFTWADQSAGGATHDATQTDANRHPSLQSNVINGHSVVRFDSTGGAGNPDWLEVADHADLDIGQASGQGFTAFVVASATATNQMFYLDKRTPDLDYTLFNEGGNVKWNTGSGQQNVFSQPSTGAFHILAFDLDQTGASSGLKNLWIDGTPGGSNPQAYSGKGVDNDLPMYIGRYQGAPDDFIFDGDFAELIIFNTALNAEDLNSTGYYLADKYGLTTDYIGADADGDGVADDADQCADTPDTEPVDDNGCSASQRDSDNDGVSDADDQCAGTPDGADVDANGCSDSQRDSDNDGVTDANDLCADTPAGSAVDANGCDAFALIQQVLSAIGSTPGPQGPQGKQGETGAAGATGAAAPCTPCADVASAAVAMACIVLDANSATSIQELRDTASTVVDTMLISANICEVGCDVAAEINTAIDTKLNP